MGINRTPASLAAWLMSSFSAASALAIASSRMSVEVPEKKGKERSQGQCRGTLNAVPSPSA